MLRLQELREDKKISQLEISKIINEPIDNYIDYETERKKIPLNVAKKLSLYFNTSIDYIAGLTNEKKPYPEKK